MLSANSGKLSRKAMIAALLVAGSFWISRDSTRAILRNVAVTDGQQSTKIIVTPQEGAPLQVLSTWIDSSKPKNFRVVVQFQNQSAKAIRAYAINSQTATSKQQNGHSEFENLTQRSAIWQPTEIRTVELSDTSLEDQINSVRVTVDFVEFFDGTTWGPDAENSRDLLAGQREGARLEKQRLYQLMQTKGRERLGSDLQNGDASTAESLVKGAHSARWRDGFRYGVASVQRHLRIAIASGDEEKIKSEFRRHFDTSEENRK